MRLREAIVSAWTVLQAKLHPKQHGDCQKPWTQNIRAHWGGLFSVGRWIMAERTQPCRTGCEPCLKRYAARWAYRIGEEIERGDRARFVTLKFRNFVNRDQAYAALRSYERLLRDKEARRAKAQGRKPTLIRRVAVMERGEQGTKRLHLHGIYVEHGPPIPRALYKERDREHPKGCWLHGFVSTKLIQQTPLKAARYLGKYLTKNPERFPGGRRLVASPFWGPGKPIDRATKPWSEKRWARFHASLQPAQEAKAAEAASDKLGLPSCALLSEPRPSADSAQGQTGPPDPSDEWVKSLICGWGEKGYDIRLLTPDEIPPEIRAKWFAKEPA